MSNDISLALREAFPFWEQLKESDRKRLAEHTMPVRYEKGATVHRGDEDCVGILLVKKGQLRIYMLSEDGRDVTLYRLFDGEVCILSASCVLEAVTFDVFIDAEEDTEVLQISSETFHQLADENIYVKCYGYELATMRFSDVMWTMQQILFMRADRRLAIFLWDEVSKSGSDEIHMTHEQVAKYMGSAREVVSRLLKYFSSEGIVTLFRGGIRVINKNKLRELI